MAPEVIMCETAKENAYNFKADIWSFGRGFSDWLCTDSIVVDVH
jgi:hypothetical protein